MALKKEYEMYIGEIRMRQVTQIAGAFKTRMPNKLITVTLDQSLDPYVCSWLISNGFTVTTTCQTVLIEPKGVQWNIPDRCLYTTHSELNSPYPHPPELLNQFDEQFAKILGKQATDLPTANTCVPTADATADATAPMYDCQKFKINGPGCLKCRPNDLCDYLHVEEKNGVVVECFMWPCTNPFLRKQKDVEQAMNSAESMFAWSKIFTTDEKEFQFTSKQLRMMISNIDQDLDELDEIMESGNLPHGCNEPSEQQNFIRTTRYRISQMKSTINDI